MNNKNFAFVMLNYNSPDVTRKCVASIIDKAPGSKIIIVDNGSADGSGKELKKLYNSFNEVKVILNDANLGFSKGLNVGYRYAKEEGYSFIALINNDTEILTENFCQYCIEDYEKFNFGVLGPQIIKEEMDDNVNPYSFPEITQKEIITYLKKVIKYHRLNVLLARMRLYDAFYNMYGFIKGNNKISCTAIINEPIVNCGLHGCFWIFSPLYVQKFDGLDEITFAYFEEWILYHKCLNERINTLYDPRIQIWHAEHTSQKNVSKDGYERFMFREKMEYEASKSLLKKLENK